MSARALLERLTADGVSIRLDGNDLRLAVEPPRTIDRGVIAEIRAAKAQVIEELRRRSKPDAAEQGTAAEKGLVDAEWRVSGCSRFTVLERADEAAEARYGACLSCGGSIELHGSPDASKWRRVESLDDVELVAARFVLASAAAIVREARR